MYFVTVIHLPWDKFNVEWDVRLVKDDLHGHRACSGYFPDLEQATKCILQNWMDIYENGSYNLAVIERIAWGIPAMVDEEWWFQAKPILDINKHIKEYVVAAIDKPLRFQQYAMWAFG